MLFILSCWMFRYVKRHYNVYPISLLWSAKNRENSLLFPLTFGSMMSQIFTLQWSQTKHNDYIQSILIANGSVCQLIVIVCSYIPHSLYSFDCLAMLLIKITVQQVLIQVWPYYIILYTNIFVLFQDVSDWQVNVNQCLTHCWLVILKSLELENLWRWNAMFNLSFSRFLAIHSYVTLIG